MLTQLERNRKIDLRRRLFEPRTSEDERIPSLRHATPEEAVEFLCLSGRDHRRYFHYTSLESLLKMLGGGSFQLSRIDQLNDLKEFSGNTRNPATYIASFGTSALENVAMWWMYGWNGKEGNSSRIPVRLEFDGKALQRLIDSLAPAKPLRSRQTHSRGERTPKFVNVKDIEWIALHDMLYQRTTSRNSDNGKTLRHGAVSWNGIIANDYRCEAFRDAKKAMPGFVKDVGWSYENETRLSIRLRSEAKHPDFILIPFTDVLRTAQIIVGPGRNAERNLERATKKLREASTAAGLENLSDWAGRIHRSIYHIQFTK